MPSQNSKAQHTPQRTCVVCKARKAPAELLSFVLLPEGVVFDLTRKLQARKSYLCPAAACLRGFDKWEKAQLKRKFGIQATVANFVVVAAAKDGRDA